MKKHHICFEVEFCEEYPAPEITGGMRLFGAPVTAVRFGSLDELDGIAFDGGDDVGPVAFDSDDEVAP